MTAGTMTIMQLTKLLADHGVKAFVVQFYGDEWRAGIRHADGNGPIFKGATPEDAIMSLVYALTKGKAKSAVAGT